MNDIVDIRIKQVKVSLMLDNPFWGSLATRLQLKNWDQDTFATDGKFIYVPDKKCYANWNREEIKGVIAHETFHCAGGHIFRMRNRHQMLWNVASDFATNSLLRKSGFQLPKESLFDQKYDGMTAEKIYNLLIQEQSTQETQMKDLLEPSSSGVEGDEEQMSKEEAAKELASEWKEAITSAARIAKGRGNLPGGMEEYIDANLFPKVSWDQILYKYLQTTKGNSDFVSYPFNRRHLYREMYLPSMVGESIEIVCAIDTSGSCSVEDLSRYISEVRGICSIFGEYKIHLYQCDTKIQGEKIEITDDSDVPTIVLGRGGTSFEPVFEEIEKEGLQDLPVIYFTDLDGSFPNDYTGDGVFWLIRKEQNRYGHEVPFGIIVEIDED